MRTDKELIQLVLKHNTVKNDLYKRIWILRSDWIIDNIEYKRIEKILLDENFDFTLSIHPKEEIEIFLKQLIKKL